MQQLYGEQKPDKARSYQYTGGFFWFLSALCASAIGLVLWICVPAIVKTIETARNSTPEMQLMDIGAVLMVVLGMLVMALVPLLMAVVMLIPCWRHRGEVITVSDDDVCVVAGGTSTVYPIELFIGVQPVKNTVRKSNGFGDIEYPLTDGRSITIHSCHLHKTEVTTDIGKRMFKRVAALGERNA
jgi:hypothetical protein